LLDFRISPIDAVDGSSTGTPLPQTLLATAHEVIE
jgi:hypothetical protein